MDKLEKVTHYKKLAHKVLMDIVAFTKATENPEMMVVIDFEHGHFMLVSDRWEKHSRYYGPLIHIEVKNDAKVWLRYDGTNLEVGNDLLAAGIPKEVLVVGFHAPDMRKYTEYAVG
jgi:hypothetical protein